MSEIGKYIYGIVNFNIQNSFTLTGVPGAREVYFIPYQDVSAVVCNSEIVDYTHMFRDTLAKFLVEHQKVIERIMSLGYTIIPMRLGTFAQDESEIIYILHKGYGLIKDIFQKINDKIELDVASVWSDFNAVIKEAGETKEIKELKEDLLANPNGISVEDQLKVGVLVKKALEQMREVYASKIQEVLKPVSNDIKKHELMDDKMVINFAFLVEKAKEREFYAKIEELNNEVLERLNFKCIGPLPPYSFYTLDVKKMDFEEVDWARKKLGILNDIVPKEEVKKAYQKQAFIFHPDKNPHKPGIEKEFEEIKRSYDILLDYAYSCTQGGQENLTFNKDEFKKNAILVKLKE